MKKETFILFVLESKVMKLQSMLSTVQGFAAFLGTQAHLPMIQTIQLLCHFLLSSFSLDSLFFLEFQNILNPLLQVKIDPIPNFISFTKTKQNSLTFKPFTFRRQSIFPSLLKITRIIF